ncbi:MAG: hypothetical protein EXQ70_01075 [Solirubrobacterales bacterium]|nr:hypothetical protein [Solirubrobacterales bacterium]
MRFLGLALIVTTLALAGCGGGDDSGGAASVPGGADPEAVEVIDSWAKALGENDIEKASSYFDLPTIIQNGTPPLRVDSRRGIDAFNNSLPCGAELTRAEQSKGYVIASFELTERTGEGSCGPGVGSSAGTAFLIEDGLITEWRRVSDEPTVAPATTTPII